MSSLTDPAFAGRGGVVIALPALPLIPMPLLRSHCEQHETGVGLGRLLTENNRLVLERGLWRHWLDSFEFASHKALVEFKEGMNEFAEINQEHKQRETS
jgi:hypothetical protein